jgi:hypothetical protein
MDSTGRGKISASSGRGSMLKGSTEKMNITGANVFVVARTGGVGWLGVQ